MTTRNDTDPTAGTAPGVLGSGLVRVAVLASALAVASAVAACSGGGGGSVTPGSQGSPTLNWGQGNWGQTTWG